MVAQTPPESQEQQDTAATQFANRQDPPDSDLAVVAATRQNQHTPPTAG
ncbi:hypothetical protein [Pseudoalteromonas sp. S2755]|nr:hypothetical protein [Pseudoalteromonas sp. S2755]